MNYTPGADRQSKRSVPPVVLNLTLPLPPGINNQYATVNGRRVLSTESRRFKQQVRALVTNLRFSGKISEQMVASLRLSYLSLFIDFYFATPMKRDLDGGLKITQDAICESLEINDNRVVDIHLVKRIDPLEPHIEVQLETIPEDAWRFDDDFVYRGSGGGDAHAARDAAQKGSA
jgi:crossover junction endodeoxyribonuclease RusA